jgi:hypothetical protein
MLVRMAQRELNLHKLVRCCILVSSCPRLERNGPEAIKKRLERIVLSLCDTETISYNPKMKRLINSYDHTSLKI